MRAWAGSLAVLILLAGCAAASAAPFRLAVVKLTLERDEILATRATEAVLEPLFPDGLAVRSYAYDDIEDVMREGRADAILGTAGQLLRLRDISLRPLATMLRLGDRNPNRNEGAAVVVRAERDDLRTLSDLRNRAVAANHPLGFAGYMVVLGEIAALGEDPEHFFGRTDFVYEPRDKDRIIEAVLEGRSDAGFLRLCAFEDYAARHPVESRRLRILSEKPAGEVACRHSTELYPGFTLAVTSKVDPETARRMTLALFSLPPSSAGSWSVPTDFESVGRLYQTLRTGPYAYLREWSLQGFVERHFAWFAALFGLMLALVLFAWRQAALLKRRDRQMRALSEELSSLQRAGAVSQLSSLFAHELRQPLATVSLYAEGLAERVRLGTVNSARIAAVAERIAAESHRASGIVDSVRAYARGSLQPRTELDAAELMDKSVRLWRTHRNADGIRLETAAGTDRLIVCGNPLELELVFVNLLKNAAEALEGTSNPLIVFSCRRQGRNIVFEVADNGRAPDDRLLAQLGRPSPSSKPGGLGLGLTIAHGIAESHGGTLSFGRSSLGRLPGLSAVVTLPAVLEKESP